MEDLREKIIQRLEDTKDKNKSKESTQHKSQTKVLNSAVCFNIFSFFDVPCLCKASRLSYNFLNKIRSYYKQQRYKNKLETNIKYCLKYLKAKHDLSLQDNYHSHSKNVFWNYKFDMPFLTRTILIDNTSINNGDKIMFK